MARPDRLVRLAQSAPPVRPAHRATLVPLVLRERLAQLVRQARLERKGMLAPLDLLAFRDRLDRPVLREMLDLPDLRETQAHRGRLDLPAPKEILDLPDRPEIRASLAPPALPDRLALPALLEREPVTLMVQPQAPTTLLCVGTAPAARSFRILASSSMTPKNSLVSRRLGLTQRPLQLRVLQSSLGTMATGLWKSVLRAALQFFRLAKKTSRCLTTAAGPRSPMVRLWLSRGRRVRGPKLSLQTPIQSL